MANSKDGQREEILANLSVRVRRERACLRRAVANAATIDEPAGIDIPAESDDASRQALGRLYQVFRARAVELPEH